MSIIMGRSTHTTDYSSDVSAKLVDLLGERGEITDPLELDVYDKLALVIQRKLHPRVRMEWDALEETDRATAILVHDGRGQPYYALQPNAIGGWEMISMRGAYEHLLSAPSRMSLALLAIANVAVLGNVGMLLN